MKKFLMFALLGFVFLYFSPVADARAVPRHAHHKHHSHHVHHDHHHSR